MYVRAEAVFSSQIEGTQSSLKDVLEAEAKILSPTRPKDVVEVVNYVKAMNYGLETLDRLPISTRLIKQVHERLLHGVRGSSLTPRRNKEVTELDWANQLFTKSGNFCPSSTRRCA